MKKSNSELKFSALKIKKIIQENKEIGKIANMAPYVICKSLFYLYISKIFRIFHQRSFIRMLKFSQRKWRK